MEALSSPDGVNITGVAGACSNLCSFAGADVNGDGVQDLVIGTSGAAGGAGAAHVVYGHTGAWATTFDVTTIDGANGFRIDGVTAGDEAGYTVNAADMTGDGKPEIMIGAPFSDPGGVADAGTVYVIYGKDSWPASYSLSNIP